MRNMLKFGLAVAGVLLLSASVASACIVDGRVICDPTGEPLAGVAIDFVSLSDVFPMSRTVVTDENGYFTVGVPAMATITATVVLSSEQWAVEPASGMFTFYIPEYNQNLTLDDFVIGDPSCLTRACWLTAGGVKFSTITGLDMGETGRKHNWGGNVNPGCSPTAGDGGSWNHLAVEDKLHFHGTHIEVVDCGNVDGIPPGSTSPVTPVNYIDFTGYGTLKGIHGNKVDYGTVYFFAHCEDRNEPGSNGQRDGEGVDRYFLNVYTDEFDPEGSSVLLVDMDGNPATVDPVTITGGNMQMHISGCDKAAVASGTRKELPPEATPQTWGAVKSMFR